MRPERAGVGVSQDASFISSRPGPSAPVPWEASPAACELPPWTTEAGWLCCPWGPSSNHLQKLKTGATEMAVWRGSAELPSLPVDTHLLAGHISWDLGSPLSSQQGEGWRGEYLKSWRQEGRKLSHRHGLPGPLHRVTLGWWAWWSGAS